MSDITTPPVRPVNHTLSSTSVLELLRGYESRNVTLVASDGSWPIVWHRAQGVRVWDPEGTEYLDLTAAFGVAATGHANERVVTAGQQQMAQLLHAMGDVHPHAPKATLARELSARTFERWPRRDAHKSIAPQGNATVTGKTLFCNSGFEAVEAALKTAALATGKPGVVAFEGAYHGLGYGALNVTHRDHFRSPFRRQLVEFADFVTFPTNGASLDFVAASVERLLRVKAVGAILAEPVQGRAGVRVPPPGFLKLLRSLADDFGALLILDEIYTGFGRTGRWFACEHSDVVPDIVCLGKGLTGGFPLSACVGHAKVMDTAWPPATGDPIHTSTFLGHPVGCAMALAQIMEIETKGLVERSASLGQYFLAALQGLTPPQRVKLEARGLGLMLGLGNCPVAC